jgi:hypothetical protein
MVVGVGVGYSWVAAVDALAQRSMRFDGGVWWWECCGLRGGGGTGGKLESRIPHRIDVNLGSADYGSATSRATVGINGIDGDEEGW